MQIAEATPDATLAESHESQRHLHIADAEPNSPPDELPDKADRRIVWMNVGMVLVAHLGCIFAPMTFSWPMVLLAIGIFYVSNGLGITLCYHRLLTHRSYRTSKFIERLLTVFACLANQNGPIWWVGVHRLHHAHADQELDPHTPRHGFRWAHVWWAIFELSEGRNPLNAAMDLRRDPFMRFIQRWHLMPQILLAVGLYFAGGWAWVVWGVCVRTVFGFHVTWFVNSAAHKWGYRNYSTDDDSRNLWWVALLTFGEGWHNNHHHAQRSAAHGHKWWEFDVTYLTIRVMEMFGLADRVVKFEDRRETVVLREAA